MIGESVSTRAFTKFGALFSLNKAIENVEARDAAAKEVVPFPRRLLKDRVMPNEVAQQERRAYEVVLQQLLNEERSLSRS